MYKFLDKKQRNELLHELKVERARRYAERIKVILLLDEGKKYKDIADFLFLDEGTIANYRKRYREGGQGIHKSLKKNPKHKGLEDSIAVLNAFRHKVSSWDDEYKRGKGLTDILSIAMGNKSLIRVSSGNIDFKLNFQVENTAEVIEVRPPLLHVSGTRFGFLYIDHQFKKKSREEADEFLTKEIERYENVKNE